MCNLQDCTCRSHTRLVTVPRIAEYHVLRSTTFCGSPANEVVSSETGMIWIAGRNQVGKQAKDVLFVHRVQEPFGHHQSAMDESLRSCRR